MTEREKCIVSFALDWLREHLDVVQDELPRGGIRGIGRSESLTYDEVTSVLFAWTEEAENAGMAIQ